MHAEEVDIAVIGAGAAGLMSGIFAGRAAHQAGRRLRICAFDGARTLGAKILVAGGGRCNVTHYAVDVSAYAGSTRNAIRKVLARFDVPQTVAFFEELGVELKREETGKLFPVTDSARTVLAALLRASSEAGISIRNPARVASVERDDQHFVVGFQEDAHPPVRANRVIISTGGKSLPKTGSDGTGYALVRALGHSVTERVFPALVPLVLDKERTFLTSLSGVTIDAELILRSASGKELVKFANSLLFTHFGISGPAALDISRYYTDAHLDDPGAQLVLNLVPGKSFADVEAMLLATGPAAKQAVARIITERLRLPESLARALCESIGVSASLPVHQLSREQRRALVHALIALALPIVGDRGFAHAEVTAGGVPLSELSLATMESRVCPGLYLAGEICDVDGRIGGFNFQWAWASGFVAGTGAAASILRSSSNDCSRIGEPPGP